MVRNYKRKTERGKWSEETMKSAVKAVLENKMGYMLAAKTFSVPQSTLERKVKICRNNMNKIGKMKVPLGPGTPVFSHKEEQELVDDLLNMETWLYGLKIKYLNDLAYQLAKRNNKPIPKKDWVTRFLARHPELHIRKPENTSAARDAGLNRIDVEKFCNFFGNVNNSLSPDHVFNSDVTGQSVVLKTESKVLAKRGCKRVDAIVKIETTI